jgi:hypothetical protein
MDVRYATLMPRGTGSTPSAHPEACANGDGTLNGYRLLSWLSGLLQAVVREQATAPSPGLGTSKTKPFS